MAKYLHDRRGGYRKGHCYRPREPVEIPDNEKPGKGWIPQDAAAKAAYAKFFPGETPPSLADDEKRVPKSRKHKGSASDEDQKALSQMHGVAKRASEADA